ncbi:hypothetical protein RMN57_02365 [Kitasatospora sp. CM 4170]|uniref:Uncharacterized protein n=1 Tax=Kitasatospora aburaviensis TaxID=67265 RepID=A0ABW1EUL7_9ACTN|nr:hypothetical protein [Kitasatospora sp. CM 4170]WNM43624.1 hypothetical protein RMN57_02365 [Kitasatospora sp. CM 4170]
MKRFARSVAGQFTISAVACAVLFAAVWALGALAVDALIGPLDDS